MLLKRTRFQAQSIAFSLRGLLPRRLLALHKFCDGNLEAQLNRLLSGYGSADSQKIHSGNFVSFASFICQGRDMNICLPRQPLNVQVKLHGLKKY